MLGSLDVLAQALVKIRENYVDEVDDAQLVSDAIDGIVTRFKALAGDVSIQQARAGVRSASSGPSAFYRQLELLGSVLETAAGKVPPEERPELVEAAIQGALHRYSSSYQQRRATQPTTEATETGGVGLELTQKDGLNVVVSALPGSPAVALKVEPGDVLAKIDGQSVQDLPLETVVGRLRGPVDSTIALTFLRNGRLLDLSTQRRVVREENVKSWVDDDIGVVRLAKFTTRSASSFRIAVQSMRPSSGGALKGLVIDIRGNTGGELDEVVGLADDFLDRGVIMSTRGRGGSAPALAKPGQITNVPVVLLIDESTASGAEIFGAALRENGRAKLIGQTSAGIGAIDTQIPLSGKTGIGVTTSRIYLPSGKSLSGNGLEPDVRTAAPTEVADPTLQAALGAIRSSAGR